MFLRRVVLFLVATLLLLLIPSSEGSINEADAIVESFKNGDMPSWLSGYIHWHRSVRSDPDFLNKEENKILLVEPARGGLADRIKDIPYFLWLAARNHRILLIEDWGLACHINEFFQPNLIDWTMNTEWKLRSQAVSLNGSIRDSNDYFNHLVGDDDFESHKDDRIVSTRSNYQSNFHGLRQVFEESNRNRKIFKYVFHSLFRLSAPIQTMLEQTKKDLGLDDGKEYLGFHLRLRYPGTSKILNPQAEEDNHGFTNITDEMTTEMLRVGENAVRCVRSSYGSMDTNIPVYGASDTIHALELLKSQNVNTIKFLPPDEDGGARLHSGHNPTGDGTHSCTKFYPALVDLWILAGAKCTAFGHGGYGSLSVMLSDFDCWSIHQFNNGLCKNPHNFPYFQNQQTNQLPECFDYENDHDIPESKLQKHQKEIS